MRNERVDEFRRVAERPVVLEFEAIEVLAQQEPLLRGIQQPRISRQSNFDGMRRQNPLAKSVERRNPEINRAIRNEAVDTFFHFSGSLVGKRQREYLLGRRLALSE